MKFKRYLGKLTRLPQETLLVLYDDSQLLVELEELLFVELTLLGSDLPLFF